MLCGPGSEPSTVIVVFFAYACFVDETWHRLLLSDVMGTALMHYRRTIVVCIHTMFELKVDKKWSRKYSRIFDLIAERESVISNEGKAFQLSGDSITGTTNDPAPPPTCG